MNLKIKTVCVFFCTLMFLFLSFFSIWKVIECNKCQKTVSVYEDQLMVSECNWIENLKLYSLIYSNYINNKDFLQEIIGERTSVLIYCFSKYMCGSCIQEDLQEIELLQKDIEKEKILLLPSYPVNREGMVELTNLLTKFNYVNIPIDSFLIPLQKGSFFQRYFAVIDEQGNLNMVFFPRSGKRNLTRLYFSEVKRVI